MDRTIKILDDYPYECLIWKNKIPEEKRLTPFLRFCPRISRITRIESCFAAFYRRQSRLMPQNAAIIRVIREIDNKQKIN